MSLLNQYQALRIQDEDLLRLGKRSVRESVRMQNKTISCENKVSAFFSHTSGTHKESSNKDE